MSSIIAQVNAAYLYLQDLQERSDELFTLNEVGVGDLYRYWLTGTEMAGRDLLALAEDKGFDLSKLLEIEARDEQRKFTHGGSTYRTRGTGPILVSDISTNGGVTATGAGDKPGTR